MQNKNIHDKSSLTLIQLEDNGCVLSSKLKCSCFFGTKYSQKNWETNHKEGNKAMNNVEKGLENG